MSSQQTIDLQAAERAARLAEQGKNLTIAQQKSILKSYQLYGREEYIQRAAGKIAATTHLSAEPQIGMNPASASQVLAESSPEASKYVASLSGAQRAQLERMSQSTGKIPESVLRAVPQPETGHVKVIEKPVFQQRNVQQGTQFYSYGGQPVSVDTSKLGQSYAAGRVVQIPVEGTNETIGVYQPYIYTLGQQQRPQNYYDLGKLQAPYKNQPELAQASVPAANFAAAQAAKSAYDVVAGARVQQQKPESLTLGQKAAAELKGAKNEILSYQRGAEKIAFFAATVPLFSKLQTREYASSFVSDVDVKKTAFAGTFIGAGVLTGGAAELIGGAAPLVTSIVWTTAAGAATTEEAIKVSKEYKTLPESKEKYELIGGQQVNIVAGAAGTAIGAYGIKQSAVQLGTPKEETLSLTKSKTVYQSKSVEGEIPSMDIDKIEQRGILEKNLLTKTKAITLSETNIKDTFVMTVSKISQQGKESPAAMKEMRSVVFKIEPAEAKAGYAKGIFKVTPQRYAYEASKSVNVPAEAITKELPKSKLLTGTNAEFGNVANEEIGFYVGQYQQGAQRVFSSKSNALLYVKGLAKDISAGATNRVTGYGEAVITPAQNTPYGIEQYNIEQNTMVFTPEKVAPKKSILWWRNKQPAADLYMSKSVITEQQTMSITGTNPFSVVTEQSAELNAIPTVEISGTKGTIETEFLNKKPEALTSTIRKSQPINTASGQGQAEMNRVWNPQTNRYEYMNKKMVFEEGGSLGKETPLSKAFNKFSGLGKIYGKKEPLQIAYQEESFAQPTEAALKQYQQQALARQPSSLMNLRISSDSTLRNFSPISAVGSISGTGMKSSSVKVQQLSNVQASASKSAQSLSLAQSQQSMSKLVQQQKVMQELSSRNALQVGTASKSAILSASASAQKSISASAQPSASITAQRIEVTQITEPVVTTLLTPLNPIIRNQHVQKLGSSSSSNKKRRGLFSVQVRSRGKFTTVATVAGESEAFGIGVQRTGSTLAASFKIKPVEQAEQRGRPEEFVSSRLYYASKKEPGVFIQRSKYRLSSIGERGEIRTAKRSRNIFMR